MIESRGVATVAIGLVRPHMERTKPPRGLWVPFPLGRPFGEPEDAAFQRRVLMAALGLLERTDGPVQLVDFPDDAPSMSDTPGWLPQIVLPGRGRALPADRAAWLDALAGELTAVRPHWEAARRRFGRTTVGNARLRPEQWAPFAVPFLSGDIPDSPVDGLTAAVVLRFMADDLKALYMEAVQATGPQPSSAQVNRWFWEETLAGQFLRALRKTGMASENNGFKTVASRFIVPAPWVKPS